MSVYNSRRYLTQALESILRQTLRGFEFVVIDDGSTDGSLELLRECAGSDSRIRLVEQDHKGLTASLNAGLRMARGDFVARMDADDIARHSRLERQVALLDEHTGVVAVGSDVDLLDPDGYTYDTWIQAHDHKEIVRRLLSGNGAALVHPSVVFRRSALIQVGGYDEQFAIAQDLDLYTRLSEVGELANVPHVLLGWRQHPSSINRTRSETWQAVKRRSIALTVERMGAARFAEALLPTPESLPPLGGYRDLARVTFEKGRLRSSLHYTMRLLRERDVLFALRVLLLIGWALLDRTLRRLLQPW